MGRSMEPFCVFTLGKRPAASAEYPGNTWPTRMIAAEIVTAKGMPGLERRLAAILAAAVVGYSVLIKAGGPEWQPPGACLCAR